MSDINDIWADDEDMERFMQPSQAMCDDIEKEAREPFDYVAALQTDDPVYVEIVKMRKRIAELEQQCRAARIMIAEYAQENCYACEGTGLDSDGFHCLACEGSGKKVEQTANE